MDIQRPDLKQTRLKKAVATIAAAVVLAAAAAFGLSRLKPALPSVDRSAIWTDTVKRGPMIRQVNGIGTLVPREDRLRLIPAETDSTVLRIDILPGANVQPGSILMELGDPQLQQELLDAQLQLKVAQVDYKNLQAKLGSDLMTERAGQATVNADNQQAQKQAETDKALYQLGVISGLTYDASQGKADELATRTDIEKQRLDLNKNAIQTQLEVQQTKVEQAKTLLALKQKQFDALTVRAGIQGVLVDLPHQVGEHVTPGTTLAEVVQPDQLKAALKIAETQARDVKIGQPAEIDTHNGIVPGTVTRVDPAVQNGTVTIDVQLNGPLPPGSRPDLSVEGTVDLDRLSNVLYMSRPAVANENSTISLFRLDPKGATASRVSVKVGRGSPTSIQILSGLKEGDTVILSDMSRWDKEDRIQIQ